MSTTSLVQVAIAKNTFERLTEQANRENRSINDLLEVMLRQAEERREAFRRMGDAMKRIQEESVRNGTSNMTMEEIDEEVAAARRRWLKQRSPLDPRRPGYQHPRIGGAIAHRQRSHGGQSRSGSANCGPHLSAKPR